MGEMPLEEKTEDATQPFLANHVLQLTNAASNSDEQAHQAHPQQLTVGVDHFELVYTVLEHTQTEHLATTCSTSQIPLTRKHCLFSCIITVHMEILKSKKKKHKYLDG